MKLKVIFIVAAIFFAGLPTIGQTFDVDDITSLKAALSAAQLLPNENHLININGNIEFDSALSSSINLEISGAGSAYELDLNGYTLTFLGADKSSKLSNLNISESTSNSGIISRNKKLTIENCTLTGSLSFGRELVRNTDGALVAENSNFLNNRAEKGVGIYFSGTNSNVSSSKFTGNTANYGGAVYVNSGSFDISGTNFSNNTSSAGGGALYITSSGTVVLDEVTFNTNSVTGGRKRRCYRKYERFSH